jgi:YD repeat-containing protein
VLNAGQTPIGAGSVRWEYDGRDNLTKIVYSSGTVVEYGYDRANRLNVVKRDGAQILNATQLHASGAMQNTLLGSDAGEVRSFDGLHRVTRIQAGKVSTLQAHLDIGYQYSDLGNVTTITDARGASESGVLGYDRLDRLTTISGFNRPQSTIVYDALGNRTALGGTYTYNQSTQRLTSRPGESFGHDSRGNVTSDGAGLYTYSPLGTMVRHTALSGAVTTYDYDVDNVRRHKSQGNNGTMYMTDEQGRVLTEWARVGSAVAWQRDYIYAGSRLLAAVTPAPLTSIAVGFTAAAQTRWENDGPAPFALVLTTGNQQPTPYPVTVRYQTVNGSAMAGSDFTGTSLTYTFPAGTPSNTPSPALTIGVVNDIDQVENPETFSIALSAVTPGITIPSGTHVVTINDDDGIVINFTAPSSTVGEAVGSAPVALVVSTPRGAVTQRAVTVSYATVGGTATQGLDYVGVSGSFVIGAGTPSGTPYGAGIPIVNDAMWENGETFTLSASAPTATVGPPHTVAIVSDDTAAYYAQVDLTTSGQAVWEYAGAVWVSAVVTTYNGGPTTAPVPLVAQTVHEWAGANPATPNVDYQALGQAGSAPLAVTVPAGTASGSVFSVALAIGNDPTDEPNEWFQFRLTPSGATSVVPLQGIWIYDDDPGAFGLRATVDSADAVSSSSSGESIAPPTDQVKPATKADLGRFRAERRRTDSTTTMTWTAGAPRP